MFGKMLLLALLLLSVCHRQSCGLKLPNYFKPCARTATPPKFAECATKNGQSAIYRLASGDRKYRIPKLNPLTITALDIDNGPSLHIALKNLQLFGLGDTKVQNARVDFVRNKCEFRLFLKSLNMTGLYNIKGRILVLPLTGNGLSRLELYNLTFTYKFDFDVYEKGPKKEQYFRPKLGSTIYNLTGLAVNFSNLFSGDKLLGPQINKFLNENWYEVSKELGPSVAKALTQVLHNIMANVCQLVPFNELFPEKL